MILPNVSSFRLKREELLKHERLNHPASRKQLEEVWEEEDGFQGERFDPKTFFYFHGKLLHHSSVEVYYYYTYVLVPHV